MGKGSAPEAPDPAATAAAQTATNIGTAIAQSQLNAVDQHTPYGSLTYEQIGSNQWTDPNDGSVYDLPQYQVTQSLSPNQQRIQDSTERAQFHLAALGDQQAWMLRNHMQAGIDQDALPDQGSAANVTAPQYQSLQLDRFYSPIGATGRMNMGIDAQNFDGNIAEPNAGLQQSYATGVRNLQHTYNGDFSEDRQRVEDALMSRMNPQIARDRDALHTRLLNQGIREGTEAYDRAMNRVDEQATDARMQAILAGGDEQSRLVGLEAQRAAFGNQTAQTATDMLANQAAFENAARGQEFGENQMRTQMGLDAAGMQQQADLSAASFQNQAAQQLFNETLARRQFGLEQQSQNNQMAMQEAAFNNDLATQNMQNQLGLQSRMDADRAAALNEAFAFQNQPINQIGALLGTGQVTSPSFVTPSVAQIPTVDRAGLEMDAYNANLNAYNAQQAGVGNMLGLGANLITGGIAGGLFD